jgi:hypothetical protein
LTLFDKEGFFFDFKYFPSKKKEDRKFSGDVAYKKGPLLGINNPSIKFVYQNGYWSFSDWNMKPDMPERFDQKNI